MFLVLFSMCSSIFRFDDLHDTKKNYQGNSNSNRSPLDLYQVYHGIQNTKGLGWWNAQPFSSHENLDSFIVCVLPRWNLVIHTVSQKIDIINITDCLSIQSLG